MIEVEAAKAALLAEVTALETIDVPLDRALGRVLAEAIAADRDLPAGDVSTMDGYAVRSGDVADGDARLAVVGEVRAGQSPASRPVGAGEAMRIYTGALVPPGADAVVMVERTRECDGGKAVEILERLSPRENIRARGEDVRHGETVLEAGTRIRAAECAALAAVGKAMIAVVRPPRVAVLSTGDEVVPFGTTPKPHQVRNSNARALLGLLEEMGLVGHDLGIVSDDPEELREAIRAGLAHDVLLLTGGVSAGRYDLVRETLGSLGTRVLFHGVAVRPGKPLLAGRNGSCLVAGLPGNPVSAFTSFSVFVAPAVRKLEGAAEPRAVELRCVVPDSIPRRPGLTTYRLARVSAVDGRLTARPVRAMGSGDVISLARANAFLIVPPGTDPVPAGTELRAQLWRDAGLPEGE